MIESVAVTLPAFLFLVVLFGGGAVFRRRNIDMDGDAPINKKLFYSSKYAIMLLWAAAVAQSWGVDLSCVDRPSAVKWAAMCLWYGGFALLFIGRLGLAEAFRIGSPQESTALKTRGLFCLSRNPMYVGVYSTLLAATLYTMNPAVLAIGAFVIAVHHKIVLAEEQYLHKAFGGEYADYCRRVRRYL